MTSFENIDDLNQYYYAVEQAIVGRGYSEDEAKKIMKLANFRNSLENNQEYFTHYMPQDIVNEVFKTVIKDAIA